MKTMVLTLALAFSITASAQIDKAPPPAPAAVDLNLAGQHLEKAGKQRNTALLVVAATGLIGGMILAMDSEQAGPALGIMGVGAVFSIGLNVSSNKHERKAGRIMQGK
jgi:hypothetical protein